MKSGSHLETLLSKGHFVATAELGPPKSADLTLIKQKASILRGFVDAVNITDNQTAIVRVSSIAAGKIAFEEGLEPIIQMTCRDRNRLAIQSDLLGAYVLGLRNLLCLSGDHQSFGNHPYAKNVYDLDSIQLVQMLKNMRDEKIFECGEEIRNTKKSDIMEPRMFLGVAANPFADPFEFRVVRLAKKIKAGADFVQTQCIFDLPKFKEWMKMVVDRGLHEKIYILAGVMPIKSYRVLQYMKNNVAGMSIPDDLIDRMKGADDPKAEGVEVCVEMIQQLRKISGIHGVHIMAVEWEEIVPEIVQKAGLSPRPTVQ
ncbi:MAG: methylenetetrahydrofolate reductase [bacterium]